MDKQRSWNYDEVAKELAMGRIDIDEETIPIVIEDARKRQDADVIAHVAEWFEDRDDIKRYLELAMEAAELGSAEANFWLGHEYRSGENLPRDYEKAYSCYCRCKEKGWNPIDAESGWLPIDPEANPEYAAEVTLDDLLKGFVKDINWWLFMLEKHPTRALKCAFADWYLKQGGDENRAKALKLFEESASEGVEFAFISLIKFYSDGEFKDIEKGRYWYYKAEEHGFDEACFANQLGVESLKCRKLKKAADNGDCRAAGKLACAYLHGGYGDYVCCPKNKDLARHYGVLASTEEAGVDELIMGLDDINLEDQKFLSEVTK